MLFTRLAWTTVGLTFALLMLGGVVHMTESSLACPVWPLCFPDQTSLVPNFGGQPLIEYSHRVTASVVGLLAIGLLAAAWSTRATHPLRFKLSVLAVVLVSFQGLLGKITVEHGLPTLVSTGHWATAMLFLALIVVLALGAFARDDRESVSDRTRLALRAALVGVYLQVVLGALVRHTGAGLACGTSPLLCIDAAWPALAPAKLHMMHRYMALAVTALVVWAFLRGRADGSAKVRRLVNATLAVVLVQVSLGVLSVTTALHMHTVTTHQGVGALLFSCLVALCYFTRTHSRAGADTTAPATTSDNPRSIHEVRALS